MKRQSAFHPSHMRERARANAGRYPWAAQFQGQIVEAARRWLRLSDDDLWAAMFGHTLTRSWMVWSNGHCPACERDVPMYTWVIDAFGHPWKVACPHCGERFPKNDFHRFYRSGLDTHGVFDSEQADPALLFNPDHPAPDDPLHLFGVDDGEGYVAGDRRWRFIGAYLIYGQWKQVVHGGIKKLAAAHVVTGDPVYAHKAGVLLDRVADLYPSFDGQTEILVYEKPHGPGYVSTWHDACIETRELALAYDQIFEAQCQDGDLVAFLGRKARQYGLDNPKASVADIQRNIEGRILGDALQNRHKIICNYPQTDIALALIEIVLGWPENRDGVFALLDPVIEQATAVDGVTGEKGLTGYSTFTIHGLAQFLGECAQLEGGFLEELVRRHPGLRQTYRFHIDTWCLQKYYPAVGDCGGFGVGHDQYQGLRFQRPGVQARDLAAKFDPGLPVSMYGLLWRLYQLTGDAAFVQVMYRANDDQVDGLPFDLFVDDPVAIQREVAQVIAREGLSPKLGSVNKRRWHLAILRSGQGESGRAVWLHYDCRRGHGHADGMNLGLFAKGLDLMPDFGYPPVQYGGWNSPQATWYKMTAAHNTVVVDGQDQSEADGTTTLWADGEQFRAVRLSGPGLIQGKQFERTVVMRDISARDFYLVDVFRVVGGTDHAKFTHSYQGQIATEGLTLRPAADYGHGTQMRNFRVDPMPRPGWSADWRIADGQARETDTHLRYTDLTPGAQAFACEAWVVAGSFDAGREAWIPRVMVRRQTGDGPLASTFVAVVEPYEGAPNIAHIRRLPLETAEGEACPESDVAVEVGLVDGQRDLLVARDVEDPLGLSPERSGSGIAQRAWDLRLEAEICLVRRDAGGTVSRIAVCRGRSLCIGEVALELRTGAEFVEVSLHQGRALVVAGRPEDISKIRIAGRAIPWSAAPTSS